MSDHELVYGIHAVESFLERDTVRAVSLMVMKGRADKRAQKILDEARSASIPIHEKTRQELDELCSGNHQGVALYARAGKKFAEADLEPLLDSLEKDPFLLILDGVTDPHNLGACLRSADAAGVQAVIVPKDNSASLNETVRKVACGAAEAVPLVAVTNLARTMRMLQERGIWITGTAGESSTSLYQGNLSGPMALVMGAEGKGMRRLTREHCDHLVFIPMAGSVSSLNVSVATGICLFEAVRQRDV